MNPYALLAGLLIWGASLGAATWWAWHAGSDYEIARLAREDDIEQRTIVASTDAAASAIAAIKVKHTTIRQELEREIQTNTVFRDCRSGPGAVGMLNASPVIAPAASSAGAGQLPASGPAR